MGDAIVDACVMRSAGETDCLESINSRSVLDAIFVTDINVIADPCLLSEWSKHASGYSVKWLAAIESQGRLVCVSVGAHVSEPLIAALRYLDDSNAACARKDAHLVMTALSYRAMVISSEISSRTVFHGLAFCFDSLFEVNWVKPAYHVQIRAVFENQMAIPLTWSLGYRCC